MTYELKPHNPDHPYVRRFVGCGHGVLFTDYCKDCEIVSLQSTYKSAIRQVQACRDGLRRLGVALPGQTSLQSDSSNALSSADAKRSAATKG